MQNCTFCRKENVLRNSTSIIILIIEKGLWLDQDGYVYLACKSVIANAWNKFVMILKQMARQTDRQYCRTTIATHSCQMGVFFHPSVMSVVYNLF